MADEDPIETIKRLLGGTSVRLGKGVVGKTSHTALGLVAVWAIVMWRLNENLTFDALLIGSAVLATLFAAWFIASSRGYAERNPALALLEGAELLEWQKMEVQAKGFSPEKNPVLMDASPNQVITFETDV